MGLNNLGKVLSAEVDELYSKGTAKGKEAIITGAKKPEGEKGPRYFLKGRGDQELLPLVKDRDAREVCPIDQGKG